MNKLLILSMSCNSKDFLLEEDMIRETWAKKILNNEYENIEWYSYRSSYDKEYHINKKKHIIFIPSKDDLKGTYEKTIKAYKYCIENFDFDFLARTNTSTYINIACLNNLVSSLDKNDNNFYQPRLIANEESEMRVYACGLFTLYSRKVVNDTIISKDLKIRNVDDAIIGLRLNKYYEKIGESYSSKFVQMDMKWFENDKKIDTNNIDNIIAFRIKDEKRKNIKEKIKCLQAYFDSKTIDALPKLYSPNFISTSHGTKTIEYFIKQEKRIIRPKIQETVVSYPKIEKNPLSYEDHDERKAPTRVSPILVRRNYHYSAMNKDKKDINKIRRIKINF